MLSFPSMPGTKKEPELGHAPATIIRIKLYGDVDTAASDLVIEKINPQRCYTAEDLCVEAASKLEIGPLSFHLFALCTPDLRQWLPPNHTIICPDLQTVEYVYRMRLRPHNDRLPMLWHHETAAFQYLYMQVRDDFVRDRLHNDMKGQKQDTVLGLGLLDMLRFCRQRNLTPDVFASGWKFKQFIPTSTKTSFGKFVDKQRLHRSYLKKLENFQKDNESISLSKIQWKYIVQGIWGCAKKYGVESFATVHEQILEVDHSFTSEKMAILLYDDTKEPRELVQTLYVEDLMDVNVKQQSPVIVYVKHQGDGVPLTEPIPFDSLGKAEDFESIMKSHPSVTLVLGCSGEAATDLNVQDISLVQITARNGKTQEFKYEDETKAMEIKNVMEKYESLEIVSLPAFILQINHSEGRPLVLGFKYKSTVDSLVSLLDAYHRMTKDYHHHLCLGVESPMIVQMNNLKCHGPTTNDWAREHLTQRNQANSEYNFLLKMSRKTDRADDIYPYILYLIPKAGQDCVVIPIRLVEDAEGSPQYQVKMQNEPTFPDVASLIEYYIKGHQPKLPLKHCVPPSNPIDDWLYLCRHKSNSSVPVGADVHRQRANVVVVNMASIQVPALGQGHFTEVYKGLWDTHDEMEDSIQTVAVKQLKPGKDAALQDLLHGVHQASFWTSPTILTIHAVCMSPQFRVIMELADLGSLEDYLNLSHRQRQDELRVNHMVMAAEQIGQALVYLQEEKKLQTPGASEEVHGNIRCRNILVFQHDRQDIKVKLADPGMVHRYNSLPGHLLDNKDRLPWIAPEIFHDLSKTSIYSDRYAFGMTVWEMFAGGEKPFETFKPTQIIDYVLEGCHLPKMDQMPLALYNMTFKCWDKDPMKRIGPRDMVKIIRTVRQCQGIGEYGYAKMQWEGAGSAFYQTTSVTQKADNEANEALERRLLSEKVRRPSEISLTPASPDERSESLFQSPRSGSFQFSDGDSLTPLLRGHSQSPASPPVSPISTDTQLTTLSNSGGEPGFHNGNEVKSASLESWLPAIAKHRVDDLQSRPLPPRVTEIRDNIDRKDVKVSSDKLLGSGHYGEVRKATYQGRNVAVKCLKSEMYEKFHREFEEEFKIMVKLKHERIVEILGMCPQRDSVHPILLVMEYVTNGSLCHFLRYRVNAWKKDPQCIPKQMCMAREIAEGMLYLSSQNPPLIHRDLASRNVLVTEEEHMKISDFGMARILSGDKDYYRTKKKIPLWWCPYEAIVEKKFTTMSDVWSFGVTVWEIFSFAKNPAFCEQPHLPHSLKEGKRLGRPENCPDGIYNLLTKKCWEFYPGNRSSFHDILEELQRMEALSHSNPKEKELIYSREDSTVF